MRRIILMTTILSVFFLWNFAVPLNAQKGDPGQVSEAVVVEVIENSEIIEEDGTSHPYQKLQLFGTEGSLKGKSFTLESGHLNQTGLSIYERGDKVTVTSLDAEGSRLMITDYVRRTPLYILIAVFVILTVLIGGKRGAFSLFGMIVTFAVLFIFVLPQISNGQNPILIIIIASIFIVPVTFFLAHGINRKTLSAVIGTFIALFLAMILSEIFINATHLTGFVSEEASFLQTLKGGTVDIRGLLFAGIIIALLGILEDITISQSAIVFQLKKANHKLLSYELFRRAMDIGRDHIASMANTLILVYAGASLPLLLLFIDNPLPFSTVINYEIIAEEIVRTLVASIILIFAVPLTTLIATIIASNFLLSDKA